MHLFITLPFFSLPNTHFQIKCTNSKFFFSFVCLFDLQEPNGVPTYLKGGVKDKIFLGITCASLVAGAVLTVDIIRSLP